MSKKTKDSNRIDINWAKVDELLAAGCDGEDIADHFGCCSDTIYDRTLKEYGVSFSSYSARKRQKGNALIKLAQFNKAVKKLDTPMLIWLGKNRLGQKDRHDSDTPPNDKLVDVLLELAKAQAEIARLKAEIAVIMERERAEPHCI